MIFTYWEGPVEKIQPTVDDWEGVGLPFCVYNDSAVMPILLNRYGPQLARFYQLINIPSCKSDIARFALLEEFGGVYVDSHTGPGNIVSLLKAVGKLKTFELVLFEKDNEARAAGRGSLVTGVLMSRAKAPIIRTIIEAIQRELEAHYEAETKSDEFVAYNIFAMVGAWRVFVTLWELRQEPYKIKEKYNSDICLKLLVNDPKKSPFVLYKHYQYREPGLHWSERQKVETLFKSSLSNNG